MVAYTHLLELLPNRESSVSGAFMFIDGMVFVISPLLLQNVTNDLNVFLIIAAVMILFSLVLFHILGYPESLKYQLTKGKFDEFWSTYEKTIVRFNKI